MKIDMPNPPKHLFVYGTLRPALAHGKPGRLIAGLRFAGVATVPGQLCDLGDYPGLIDGDGLVHGDVLEIDHPKRLVAIDSYEECDGEQPLFRREQTVATFPEGHLLQVWVYRYCQPITNCQFLPDGVYRCQRD